MYMRKSGNECESNSGTAPELMWQAELHFGNTYQVLTKRKMREKKYKNKYLLIWG